MKPKMIQALSIAMLLTSATAFAHHSFAMFDMTRQVKIQGQVKEFQWTNPHAWLQVMAPNDKGEVVEWSLELGSPNMLVRSGIKKNTFTLGDKVTIEMNPTKDGSPGGALAKVIFPDGKIISVNPGGNSATITK